MLIAGLHRVDPAVSTQPSLMNAYHLIDQVEERRIIQRRWILARAEELSECDWLRVVVVEHTNPPLLTPFDPLAHHSALKSSR